MKRGQGISINMIIIMVIGLLVLVVSAILIMKYSGKGDRALNDCEGLGGECVAGTTCTPPAKPYTLGTCQKIPGEADKVCCTPLEK